MAQIYKKSDALPPGVKEIIKYELAHYKEYKRKIDIYETQKNSDPTLVVTEYLRRINDVCMVIDYALTQVRPERAKLVQDVYIRKVNSIKRYSIENYIDLSRCYCWANEVFNIIAIELGYIDTSELFRKKYVPIRGW